MRELERRVLLSVLDRKWREHLYEMDYLREGIGLRAYSQRDPLVEYQREGFDMFSAMMDGIKEESVGFLFNLEVQVEEEQPAAAAPEGAEFGSAVAQAAAHARRPAHRGEGPRGAEAAAAPRLLRARRERRGRGRRRRRRATDGRPVRRGRPQRGLPLRLGQEVQEVPRRSRAARPA